ncbi:MAG: lasso peptide biosynthesis protein [Gammaproteobacteria bacterium]|nr:lasso peptide biosynthesis protein [Gammaproteobacteria bacterium]MDH5650409.1 lasso peptide biosynthesis protein [Gammaproteobacteria bacterium]
MTEKNSRKQSATSTPQFKGLIFLLIALACSAFFIRMQHYGNAHLAGGDRLWRLAIDARVQSSAYATTLQIHPPQESARQRVIQRKVQHAGFRIRNASDEKDAQNRILALATQDGKQRIVSEFIIHLIDNHQPQQSRPVELDNTLREKYLRDSDALQINHLTVRQTLRTIRKRQAAQQNPVDNIFHYLRQFKISDARDVLNVPETLAAQRATTLDRSLAMVSLCRAAGIPARVITGILLKDDIDPRPHFWVEVFMDEKWQSYDVQYGYQASVPQHYLAMRRNGEDIVQVQNGELLRVDFDLEQEFNHPYLHSLRQHSLLDILDLTRLPIDTRNELALLLLLPLGALITALCRHLVGLHSYGVFTPTLLALAMVYTDTFTTLIIFLIVCSLAFVGRRLFPDSMSRVPRLATIFTLVALLMTLSASVMNYFELGQGGRVVLLPIIILTATVDRLYRTIEDKGLRIATRRLLWTLLITLLCLPLIRFDAIGHWLLQFPETHLITLALFLLIAGYKGKQLIHLPVIRYLAEPETGKRKSTSNKEKDDNDAS